MGFWKKLFRVSLPSGKQSPAAAKTAPGDVSFLIAATSEGDIEKCKTLLEQNPNLVFGNWSDGLTPLHWAALRGEFEVVNLLLSRNPEINARSKNGQTPLHSAVTKGRKRIVELLLTHGADVNAKAENGWTPLHIAELMSHEDVATLLRKHGGR